MEKTFVNTRAWLLLMSVFLLAGCVENEYRETEELPIERVEDNYRQQQPLLNIGVPEFGFQMTKKKDQVLDAVRKGESIWYAKQLKTAIDETNAWQSVWVVPKNYNQIVDVQIIGKIIESNGEVLQLQIRATDSTGKDWFHKQYKQKVQSADYKKLAKSGGDVDPYQNLFNKIANDLLSYRDGMSIQQTQLVKKTTKIRYAHDLSPSHFGGYISVRRNNQYHLERLPADDDPAVMAVERIAVRDQLFQDAVQDHYRLFVEKMSKSYQEWRSSSYESIVAKRKLEQQATLEKIGGVLAVVGGIASLVDSAGGGSSRSRKAKQIIGAAAIAGGAALVRSGYRHSEEAKIHLEILIELGESIEKELEPRVEKVEDKTITLTGTMEAQFKQWQEYLQNRYLLESGQ